MESAERAFQALGGGVEPDYYGFRNVVTAADGTHIPFLPTRRQKKAAANRKGYISLIMHAFFGAHLQFYDVDIGAYGSQGDSNVMQFSPFGIKQVMALPDDKPIPRGKAAVVDAAYPAAAWLLKPFDVEPDEAHVKFDKMHSKLRFASERGYGKFKQQFRLFLKANNGHIATSKFAMACAVLHNLTVEDASLYDWDEHVPDPHHGVNDGIVAESLTDADMNAPLSSVDSVRIGEEVRELVKAEWWARELQRRAL